MTRLKRFSPGPAQMARPSLATANRDEARAARDRMRARQDHRRLYQSKEWRALRLAVLERDGWVCQATGVYLVAGRTAPNAAVVDHITPHRGDPALFFDASNCRAVSKAWHDSEKQKAEKAEAAQAARPGGWVRF